MKKRPDGTDLLLFLEAAKQNDVDMLQKHLDLFGSRIINMRTDDLVTALMEAAENGHVESVKLLLEAGAKTRMRDMWGNTAAASVRERRFELSTASVILAMIRETEALRQKQQREQRGAFNASAMHKGIEKEIRVETKRLTLIPPQRNK